MEQAKPAPRSLIGLRVQIPVHYDAWMRGAHFGVIRRFIPGKPGQSDCFAVKMDHPGIKKQVRVWRLDWDYLRFAGVIDRDDPRTGAGLIGAAYAPDYGHALIAKVEES